MQNDTKYWVLPKPEITVKKTYDLCISNVEAGARRDRLVGYEEQILKIDKDYPTDAPNGTLHTIVRSKRPDHDTRIDDMTWFYEQKLVGGPGREVYNSLRLSTTDCPLCGGANSVYTLDHHLAKTVYPFLAISPLNLLPACYDCNTTKKKTVLELARHHTIHPYFDNAVEEYLWLVAELNEDTPPSISFSVEPPDEMPALLRDRISEHFRTFELKQRFQGKTSSFLSTLRYLLPRHFIGGQAPAVRSELIYMAEGYPLNSWQGAACRALSASNWYCSGGFAF